jgi:transcription initiation factor TFIIB
LVILERVLEPGPEWRRGGGGERERADTNAGVDFTLHDLGIGTRFQIPQDVSPAKRARFRRMHVLQKRSRAGRWHERSLRDALIELDKMCEDLAIPKGVKAEACVLYRRAKAKGLTMGRDSRLMLAAVIFVTCRMRGLPRTEGEVVGAMAGRRGFEGDRDLKNLRRVSKLLKRRLRLEVPRISPHEYIDKFSIRFSISRRAVELAHDLYHRIPDEFTRSRSPIFLAAVFIYLGAREAGERLTLKQVAEGLGVGVSSLSQGTAWFKGLLARESR